MSKRKFPKEADEEFILKTNLNSHTAVKKVVIHDFKRRMVEAENCPKISSPTFQLAGINMFVTVFPKPIKNPGSIFIGLTGHASRHDQLTSGKVIVNKEASGGKVFFRWEMKKVVAGKWCGYTWLSKAGYKKYVKKSGDILELEVTVTVHSKVNTSSGGEWTRYYQSCISLLYSYLCVVQD